MVCGVFSLKAKLPTNSVSVGGLFVPVLIQEQKVENIVAVLFAACSSYW